jgi:hypothetical protein
MLRNLPLCDDLCPKGKIWKSLCDTLSSSPLLLLLKLFWKCQRGENKYCLGNIITI